VEHHARILQQGVHARAVRQTLAGHLVRVGEKTDQRQKTCHHRLRNQQQIRHGARVGGPVPPGGQRRIQRQNPHPQQQRAFMPAPQGGGQVEQGQIVAGMSGDVIQRIIVRQESVFENADTDGQRQKHQKHGVTGRACPARRAAQGGQGCADTGQCKAQGQAQGEMSNREIHDYCFKVLIRSSFGISLPARFISTGM
jgi:hypothetical protein